MRIREQLQQVWHFARRRLLSTIGIIIGIIMFCQLSTVLYGNFASILSRPSLGTTLVMVGSNGSNDGSSLANHYVDLASLHNITASGLEKQIVSVMEPEEEEEDRSSFKRAQSSHLMQSGNRTTEEKGRKPLHRTTERAENSRTNASSNDNQRESVSSAGGKYNNQSNFTTSLAYKNPVSMSLMNLLMLQNLALLNSTRPLWSSARDVELQKARFQIENAPVIRNAPEVPASLFRNYSMFRRSYELMERVLKVYVYKEGEKPIFHYPYMRGIYASEGWFMKLMEGNKQFVVKNPKRAHLFYIPFSSLRLRSEFRERNPSRQKDLENHLNGYMGIISRKYRFWNRTEGADHFLVACHDWAPKFTRKNSGSCNRALCNTNIASGFKIGKDVSLPVTYVRSAENPLLDLGGKPPSERRTLAFFAGGMHGYLRPILLQHWQNKVSDMKIFGPMPRDIEGKARYREFMKSSKYCICARGYEVHTPRLVESIYYECVPVIISDNYVPPFFEVLDWEAFSVFISEKDIPNLRNILLSISDEKYILMQKRLKMVQKHFLWHKNPAKYDLFHMILHSIWYNRIFQLKHTST